jgi:hypothetical protein
VVEIGATACTAVTARFASGRAMMRSVFILPKKYICSLFSG